MFRSAVRALLLALMIVIPLRLLAAGVVPIVGAPGHAHDSVRHEVSAAAEHHAWGARDGCAAHAASSDAPAELLHEHGCPHLSMAIMSAPVISANLPPQYPRGVAHIEFAFDSVVLDVLLPPPTARN